MPTSDLPSPNGLSAKQIADESLRLAAEVSGVGFWALDTVTQELVWDARTREVFYVADDEEVTLDLFYDRLHPDDRERVRSEVGAALDPDIRIYDTEYRVTGGPVRWVRARGRAFFDDAARPIRFLGIVIDITHDKSREAELARLSREALAQNDAKDEFLAKLGHELRNPLSPIAMGVQLLRDRGVSDPALDAVHRHVGHVSRLVDDLLDVARITNRKMTIRRTANRFGDIVSDAVDAVSEQVKARGQTVCIHGSGADRIVHLDQDRMRQVIQNLLDNASKFSEPASEIEVDYTCEVGRAVIEVRDHGAGVEPRRLPALFESFAQEPQPIDRAAGGLGLGLSIVKGLVELHGGVVRATSAGIGHGLTVRVEVPTDGPVEDAKPVAPRGALPARRVMIVDDNRDLCEILGDLLSVRGHEVRLAFDGAEALELAKTFEPDIAFLDLGLPEVDGFTLAVRLQEERGAQYPLVAMSGYGMERDRERSAEAGFARHLVKPVAPAVVLAAIAELTEA